MAVSNELLNTTFADKAAPLVDASARESVFFDIVDKMAKPGAGGTYIERNIAGQSPAVARGVYATDEVRNMTRRPIHNKYQMEYHRVIAAVSIPNYEMEQNSGPAGALKLITDYPEQFSSQFFSELDSYLLTGTIRGLGVVSVADLAGFLTLNGLFASGLRSTTTNGLLGMTTPAGQAGTVVQGLAKATNIFHYNQWDSISSWATDGEPTWRAMARKCAAWSGKKGGRAMYVIADPETYGKYDTSKQANVRVSLVSDKTEDQDILSLDLMGAKVCYSEAMDRANFGSPASTGIAYFLNPDWFEVRYQVKPKLGKFVDGPINTDYVAAPFAMQMAWLCRKLTAQGAVTGGAT